MGAMSDAAIIAELMAALTKAQLERDQQERFKWRANERADRAEAALARLGVSLAEVVSTDGTQGTRIVHAAEHA